MTFEKGEGSTFSKADSSTQSCQSNISEADSIEYLAKIVKQIDGGGIELMNEPA